MVSSSQKETAAPGGMTRVRPAAAKPSPDNQPKKQPPYNVILLDDDEHTYAYVIAMMQMIFGHSKERGYKIAREVDSEGRAIVLTTTREHAELKRDQIHAMGPDPLMAHSKGSMTALIEPVEDD